MKFKNLKVPDHWEHYWTRFPEGYTILEALISWVSQVDSMVDNQNKLNDNVEQFRNEIDAFVERFDDRLQDEVTQTLQDWQTSGFLDVVISEALQWQLTDYIATNEQDKVSINQQLTQIDESFVSVKYFGATGDGVTDDTLALQSAFDSGKNLYFPKGVYMISTLTLTTPQNINLNGATLKRAVPGPRMLVAYSELSLFNGVIDGDNKGDSYGHLLEFNTQWYDLKIDGVDFKNNCLGYPSPTKGQETDGVNIVNAKNAVIINSTFDTVSRNGIAVTGKVKTIKAHNNSYRYCYLMGFDVEPNAPVIDMYDLVSLGDSQFINCGPRSIVNSVFPSGGPYHIGAPRSAGNQIIRNVKVFNNFVDETEIKKRETGFILPYIHINSYKYATFIGNTILGIDRINFNWSTPQAKDILTVISDNIMTRTPDSTIDSNLFSGTRGNATVANNLWQNVAFTGGLVRQANNATEIVVGPFP